MDVREKLVELLENHCAVIGEDNCKASQSGKCTPRDCAICLASDLIANGVTVQEWILVAERMPDDDNLVVCLIGGKDYPEYDILRWDNADYRWDNGAEWFYKDEITHWMPLPESPKEG